MKKILVAVVLAVTAAGPSLAADAILGPIAARVVSVYDGDTITVDAEIWPGVTIRTGVRLDGIDTPEIRGKCQAEKDLAVKARDFVRVRAGERVQLVNVRNGKYAGRVVADVLVDGHSVALWLVGEGLARPYDGGRRAGWC